MIVVFLRGQKAGLQLLVDPLDIAAHLLQEVHGLLAVEDRQRGLLALLIAQQVVENGSFQKRIVDGSG